MASCYPILCNFNKGIPRKHLQVVGIERKYKTEKHTRNANKVGVVTPEPHHFNTAGTVTRGGSYVRHVPVISLQFDTTNNTLKRFNFCYYKTFGKLCTDIMNRTVARKA
jgi:hypothetical protein